MSAEPTQKADFSRLKILVADDNRFMRVLVRSLLHSFGIKQCPEAEDGAEGLKILKSTEVDIIITDLSMSPFDGIEFTQMVRTSDDSSNPFIPIIMMSGHTEAHRITEARDAGINEFLAKPISAKSLYARIHSVIFNPRPFIRSRTYYGPDRRRRRIEWAKAERRQN